MSSELDAGEWQHIKKITLKITNAALADDEVLQGVYFDELSSYCEQLFEKHGQHPMLLETLADFDDDPDASLDYYSRASSEALKRGMPINTIHVSWAEALLEPAGDPGAAVSVLEQCRRDVELLCSQAEKTEYSRIIEKAREACASSGC